MPAFPGQPHRHWPPALPHLGVARQSWGGDLAIFSAADWVIGATEHQRRDHCPEAQAPDQQRGEDEDRLVSGDLPSLRPDHRQVLAVDGIVVNDLLENQVIAEDLASSRGYQRTRRQHAATIGGGWLRPSCGFPYWSGGHRHLGSVYFDTGSRRNSAASRWRRGPPRTVHAQAFVSRLPGIGRAMAAQLRSPRGCRLIRTERRIPVRPGCSLAWRRPLAAITINWRSEAGRAPAGVFASGIEQVGVVRRSRAL